MKKILICAITLALCFTACNVKQYHQPLDQKNWSPIGKTYEFFPNDSDRKSAALILEFIDDSTYRYIIHKHSWRSVSIYRYNLDYPSLILTDTNTIYYKDESNPLGLYTLAYGVFTDTLSIYIDGSKLTLVKTYH